MSEHHVKTPAEKSVTVSKFNTLLISIVGAFMIAGGTVAYGVYNEVIAIGKAQSVNTSKLDTVQSTQDKLWRSMMPRHEIEIELANIKKDQENIHQQNTELQIRLTALEISVAKLNK